MSIIPPTKFAHVVYRTHRLTVNQFGRTGDVLYIADTGNHRIRRIALTK